MSMYKYIIKDFSKGGAPLKVSRKSFVTDIKMLLTQNIVQ